MIKVCYTLLHGRCNNYFLHQTLKLVRCQIKSITIAKTDCFCFLPKDFVWRRMIWKPNGVGVRQVTLKALNYNRNDAIVLSCLRPRRERVHFDFQFEVAPIPPRSIYSKWSHYASPIRSRHVSLLALDALNNWGI